MTKPVADDTTRAPRTVTTKRSTRETQIELRLDIDGSGRTDIATGLGFLDHMIDALAHHAAFDLELRCKGDTDVDDHHTVEDCAIVLGQSLDSAIDDRRGLCRFASAYAPLDEALSRSVVDLVARPFARIDMGLTRDRLGDVSCENLPHFLSTLAIAGRFCLHVDVLEGDNDHHRVESAFKATALALRDATRFSATGGVSSTKGTLS